MWWLLAFVAVLFLATRYRPFRTALLWLVASIVLVWSAAYLYEEAELKAARQRIPPSEIELSSLSLNTPHGFFFTGRVRNNSPRYVLTGLAFELTVSTALGRIVKSLTKEPPPPTLGCLPDSRVTSRP